jgi:hypothetical protein
VPAIRSIVNALGASHEGGFANPNLTGNEDYAALPFENMDRAIDSIEKRACSKQQNSSYRRGAAEGEPRYKARCDAQDGRAVGAEPKAKKCAGERQLYVLCRGASAENCVEHVGDGV